MINYLISNFQNICICINFFILFPLLGQLIKNTHRHLIEWENHKNHRAYLLKAKFSDLYYVVFFTSFLILLRLYWKKYIYKNLNISLIKFDNGDDLAIKYEKIYTGSFKSVYFIFTSVWGYYLLYKSEYIPYLLGGQSSTQQFLNIIFKDLPFQNVENMSLKIYYFWNFSYHLMSTLFHLTQTKRKNWQEMTMHHIITLILITFSYVLGLLKIGHIVMLIHDIPDIFIYTSKFLYELKNTKKLLIVTYITGLVGCFAYFRIYVFSLNIIYPLLIFETDYKHFENSINYFRTLLILLLLLHIYWYCLIIYMITKLLLGQKINDKNEEYKR